MHIFYIYKKPNHFTVYLKLRHIYQLYFNKNLKNIKKINELLNLKQLYGEKDKKLG